LSREQQLARVIEGSDQGYWDWNVQTDDFQVSHRWKAMLGYAPDRGRQRQMWLSHIHPEDLPLVEDTMQRHLDGLTPAYEMEMRCKSLCGGWRWILSRGRVVERDAQGQPLMMSGTHTDITEHKIHALAQKEAAIVFDSSYEGIMVVSPARRITKVNTAFTRITGFAEDEALGSLPACCHPASMAPPSIRKCGPWCASTTSGVAKYGTGARMAIFTPNCCPFRWCVTSLARSSTTSGYSPTSPSSRRMRPNWTALPITTR
jgi:PAS domain S-box-containing protein